MLVHRLLEVVKAFITHAGEVASLHLHAHTLHTAHNRFPKCFDHRRDDADLDVTIEEIKNRYRSAVRRAGGARVRRPTTRLRGPL